LFTTGGMLLTAVTYVGLLVLPADFSYPAFAALLALNGIGTGLFSAPNTTAIMNSVPAHQRGASAGMATTFQNAGMVLSIGVFFSLLTAGLADKLPGAMRTGLAAQGVPAAAADTVAGLPPVGTMFAAFLGFNPIAELLGPTGVLDRLPAANAATLTGKEFFPHLLAGPFHHGLVVVFVLATVMSVVAALVSLVRGRRYVHVDAAPDLAADEAADRETMAV
jgi:hypothetical protein